MSHCQTVTPQCLASIFSDRISHAREKQHIEQNGTVRQRRARICRQFAHGKLLGDRVRQQSRSSAPDLLGIQITLHEKGAPGTHRFQLGNSLVPGCCQNPLTLVVLFTARRQDFHFPQHASVHPNRFLEAGTGRLE